MSPSAEAPPDRPALGPGEKLLYLFTTFPVLTETFLQREVRALRHLGVDLELHSIWKGEDDFEGIPVRRFRLHGLFRLLTELPYWLLKRPRRLTRVLRSLRTAAPANFQNFQENALGLAYGIILARQIARNPPAWTHAAWATMPATAALTIEALTDQPFSTGAHAYDIFQGGGDWILSEKLRRARFLHTSTAAARDRLIALGADRSKVLFLRRGLLPIPPQRPPQPIDPTRPLHLLTVGRLVSKKYLHLFLETAAALNARGIPSAPQIIGEGPLLTSLRSHAAALGLDPDAIFLGRQSPAIVDQTMRAADVFLFTGKPAPDGDRDGLPNVIPEAMAIGLPVVASNQPGVREAIIDHQTGFLIDSRNPTNWAATISDLFTDPDSVRTIVSNARQWVETHFNALTQTQALLDRIRSARHDP